jgi:hypothetical protein
MFFFGHLGIGSKIVSPLTRGLPKKAVLLGTILPDLIDKPLYYGLSLATGKQGSDLGLVSGSRTFAHTALFLLVITCAAILRRSKPLAALSLGIASHLLLDSLSSYLISHPQQEIFRSVIMWPLNGWAFPIIPFHNLGEHLSTISQPSSLAAEGIGLILLGREWHKTTICNQQVGRKSKGVQSAHVSSS